VGPNQPAAAVPTVAAVASVATAAITAALIAFVALRLSERNKLPIFLVGWFVLLIAPMLPLPNHVIEYYVTVPGIGLAWLAGWALVSAWRAGWVTRLVGSMLALVYVTGSVVNADITTSWHLNVTSRIRIAVRAVEGAIAKYPGSAIALAGLDDEVFLNSAPHHPFELVGATEVWLLPDADKITERAEFGDLSRFRTSREELLAALAAGKARVLDVSANEARDVTGAYSTVLGAEFLAAHRGFVNVGVEAYAPRLAGGWHPIENGSRWSAKRAELWLGVRPGAARLRVTGYAPAEALAAGPVTLQVSLDGRAAGSLALRTAGDFEAELPISMAAPGYARVAVECSRALWPPGDPRELGLVFGTFEIR
jgi:hypothetical protein